MTDLTLPVTVFFDSDVMIAGSASTTGASHMLLKLSEISIIKGIISRQVAEECRKNIRVKLPTALPVFNEIISRSVIIKRNPSPGFLSSIDGQAHPKDLPILAAALKSGAHFLVTFNVKDYFPVRSTGIEIIKPGNLLQEIREYYR